MAVAGFACTYGITKVALCAPGVIYKPFYYFSRCCSRPRVKKNMFWTSDNQVPSASVLLAEPGHVNDPYLLDLDPGLHSYSGAVLQCCQSGGQ